MTGHHREHAGVANGSPAAVQRLLLDSAAYLADHGLATTIFLGLELGQPLLLEGDAGVGKTEAAKAVATALDRELIRLQCYEGIDASEALYEWDYPRQLLYLKALSEPAFAHGEEQTIDDLFGPRFLLERPLLRALRAGDRAVLLIDEIDRADDQFEAFLLELLSDFQITIPELGTVAAERPPFVILTSNRTRELHDALKRRCLYHWIDFPDVEREIEILRMRAPGVPARLAAAAAEAVARLRQQDLNKAPGIAETINWARALALLGIERLEQDAVAPTLGTLLKDRDDLARVRSALADILGPVSGMDGGRPQDET